MMDGDAFEELETVGNVDCESDGKSLKEGLPVCDATLDSLGEAMAEVENDSYAEMEDEGSDEIDAMLAVDVKVLSSDADAKEEAEGDILCDNEDEDDTLGKAVSVLDAKAEILSEASPEGVCDAIGDSEGDGAALTVATLADGDRLLTSEGVISPDGDAEALGNCVFVTVVLWDALSELEASGDALSEGSAEVDSDMLLEGDSDDAGDKVATLGDGDELATGVGDTLGDVEAVECGDNDTDEHALGEELSDIDADGDMDGVERDEREADAQGEGEVDPTDDVDTLILLDADKLAANEEEPVSEEEYDKRGDCEVQSLALGLGVLELEGVNKEEKLVEGVEDTDILKEGEDEIESVTDGDNVADTDTLPLCVTDPDALSLRD